VEVLECVAVITALAALATAILTRKHLLTNRDITREERFFNEMNLLIKVLYSHRKEYKRFEPHHVDHNNHEEVNKASEFWRQIRENKYLAPKDLRDAIDKYLSLVESRESNIKKHRTSLSEKLTKRCRDINKCSSPGIEVETDEFIKTCLCPQLGDNGIVKPIPLDERLETEFLNAWDTIVKEINKYINTVPDELWAPALDYIGAIRKPFDSGPDCFDGPRNDLSNKAEKRYEELEKKIENIKANLEVQKPWWRLF